MADNPEVIEYCHSYNFMFQGDFSVHQVPQGSQMHSIVHHCWALDAKGRNGIRFDGDPAGIRAQVHHVVCRNTDRGTRLKGDQHQVYNLTSLDNGGTDINIAFDKFYGYDPPESREYADRIMGRRGSDPYHGNENSIARNLAADVITTWPLPILDTNNATKIWHGNVLGKSLADQLRDPANLDFRPKAGSDLVDAGDIVPGVTDGFSGAAPDIGAYEYDSANYWIPGCRFRKSTTPIPPNGTTTARADADLMWLEGRDAVSNLVYFGAVSGALDFKTNQVNNIFSPGLLTIGQTYYWRIDTLTPSGVVPGDEWRFTPALYVGGTGTAGVTNLPVADTYVDSTNPSANYGGSTVLELRTPEGNTNSLDITRHGYMKFDVDLPGKLISAKLRLYSGSVVSGGVDIHGVNDTTWTESGLTWNNRPPMDPASLAFETPNAGYAEFDVTSWVAGIGTFSLGLVRGPKDSNREVRSREYTAAPPQLVLVHGINHDPSFNSTTVGAGGAFSSYPYNDSLAAEASDPDGDALSFHKVAGPGWLAIAPDGTLSGTPGTNDVGTQHWTIRVEDPYGGSDEALLDISVMASLYNQWAAGYSLIGGDADLLADPDGDRLSNLVEYGLGGVPTLGNDAAAILPTFGISDDSFQYIYRRRTDAEARGLAYWLELNTNLSSGIWITNGYSEAGTAPLETGFEAVTNRIPTTEANQFIRLRISID